MGATGTEFDAEYGADQIQILEGLEAIRKRPGMLCGIIYSLPSLIKILMTVKKQIDK